MSLGQKNKSLKNKRERENPFRREQVLSVRPEMAFGQRGHSELCPTDFTLLPFMARAFISLHRGAVFTSALFSSMFLRKILN